MEHKTVDYMTLPLEQFTVTDLTDAIGVAESATLLNTSKRAVYTIRNTNVLHVDRVLQLINAVRAKEPELRARLSVMRNMQRERKARR
jgi:hypothetical protein